MTTKQITPLFFLIALLVSSCASPLRAAMVDTATPAPTFTVAPSETPTIEPTATMAMRATPTLIAPLPTFTWTPLPTLTPFSPRTPTLAPTWNGVVVPTAVPVIVATSPALDGDGGYYDYAAALEIVRLTNEFRVQNGKKPLAVDERLMDIARKRAKEIVKDFSHDGLDTYCGDRGENAGKRPSRFFSAGAQLQGWMDSSGHRTNLLYGYSKICVGTYFADGVFHSTQVFGL